MASGLRTSKKFKEGLLQEISRYPIWPFNMAIWNVETLHWDVENVQKFNSSHYLLFRTGLLKTKSFPLMESADNNNYKIWEIAIGWCGVVAQLVPNISKQDEYFLLMTLFICGGHWSQQSEVVPSPSSAHTSALWKMRCSKQRKQQSKTFVLFGVIVGHHRVTIGSK